MKHIFYGIVVLVNFIQELIGEKYLIKTQEGNVTENFIVEVEEGTDYNQQFQRGELVFRTIQKVKITMYRFLNSDNGVSITRSVPLSVSWSLGRSVCRVCQCMEKELV